MNCQGKSSSTQATTPNHYLREISSKNMTISHQGYQSLGRKLHRISHLCRLLVPGVALIAPNNPFADDLFVSTLPLSHVVDPEISRVPFLLRWTLSRCCQNGGDPGFMRAVCGGMETNAQLQAATSYILNLTEPRGLQWTLEKNTHLEVNFPIKIRSRGKLHGGGGVIAKRWWQRRPLPP